MTDYDDVWIVIPVYNEGAVIADVVERTRETFPNIVCVDDGSRDDSAERIATTGAHLVRHPVNLGQGAALQTGISYALAQPGMRYLVTFDADGQHRVEDAQTMLAVARTEGADVVLGSRFLEENEQIPLLKRVVLRTVVTLSPTARKLKLSDAHNGLRVLSRSAAERIHITQDRMAHASEILSAIAALKLTYREAPVTITYTDYSVAKGQRLSGAFTVLRDLMMRSLYR